ncbi:IclR family transcriptional regulator [Verminephrobacter eiseniae]|uniref:IclR family transcriptional regulator n=1 Tax=Verminephrobacter eiseniae TaxID=364317 RepID=UPI0022384BC7|nr:IclR family transcriptional regulator [Verminephrobacter eiseniae]MCW5259097.1 IclR family transcriptional regulator [Verminephrobacter eiseniae]
MPQIVPAAQRALQVFEVFARERRPLTNSDLAQALDLAGSSCSDLVYTLIEAGYLLRTPKGRLLYPTSRLGELVQRFVPTDPLQMFAAEALELLSKRSGETSMCGYLVGNKIKIFSCQESPRALRYVLLPGTELDVHSTALGKAILGALAPAERDTLIDLLPMTQATPHSIQDRGQLRKEIEEGIKKGTFTAREEGGEGVTAIGIAGKINGRVTALSLVGPTSRMEKSMDQYVGILLQARGEFF